MKTYIITTGVIFALITLAHLLRIVTENKHLATDPFFMIITLLSTGLSLWAFLVLRRSKA